MKDRERRGRGRGRSRGNLGGWEEKEEEERRGTVEYARKTLCESIW